MTRFTPTSLAKSNKRQRILAKMTELLQLQPWELARQKKEEEKMWRATITINGDTLKATAERVSVTTLVVVPVEELAADDVHFIHAADGVEHGTTKEDLNVSTLIIQLHIWHPTHSTLLCPFSMTHHKIMGKPLQ